MEAQVTDTPSSDAQAQAIGGGAPPPSPGGITMKQLLEAGVHFGHQTQALEPEDEAVHLRRAQRHLHHRLAEDGARWRALPSRFVADVSARGASVLFVGTKKQAQDVIREEAPRSGQFYVTSRWLGGTLTNFRTIKQPASTG